MSTRDRERGDSYDEAADEDRRALGKGSSSALGRLSEDAKGDAASSNLKIRDRESRRNMRWLSFAKPKLILGFEHLSPAYIPSMGSKSKGMSVCFDRINGWRPPRQLLQELDDGGFEISAQLSFSLFHLTSGTFFGSTWMGSPFPLGGNGRDKLPDVIDFEYSDIVYLISRITDPSCIAVVEIVASKEDVRKKMVVAQYGCGWTMLNLFGTSHLADIAEGHENIEPTVS